MSFLKKLSVATAGTAFIALGTVEAARFSRTYGDKVF